MQDARASMERQVLCAMLVTRVLVSQLQSGIRCHSGEVNSYHRTLWCTVAYNDGSELPAYLHHHISVARRGTAVLNSTYPTFEKPVPLSQMMGASRDIVASAELTLAARRPFRCLQWYVW